MLKALIFDFDGIIVNTEPLHYRAFQEILRPLGLGYSWDRYVEEYMGYDDRDAFLAAFREGGRSLEPAVLGELIGRKAQAFQEIISAGVEPYPGVVELIKSAAHQLPVALCSGALPSDIDPILAQLGLSQAFETIVTAADVSVSKPDPASYALTVARLAQRLPNEGITSSCCLAIEDTPAGIASATGAGLAVVAVTNSYPESMLGGAILALNSLLDIDLDRLKLLV